MSETRHRRSIRLKEYDYSQAASYFVTICTQNREALFGCILDGKMILNQWGEIVKDFHAETEAHFETILMTPFVIMPNHYHAIIVLNGRDSVNGRDHITGRDHRKGRGDPAPTVGNAVPTLGNVVGFFKYQTSKRINLLRQTPGQKLWQRNYYEHVIRDETDYNRICKYIENNPLKWESDSLRIGSTP